MMFMILVISQSRADTRYFKPESNVRAEMARKLKSN